VKLTVVRSLFVCCAVHMREVLSEDCGSQSVHGTPFRDALRTTGLFTVLPHGQTRSS